MTRETMETTRSRSWTSKHDHIPRPPPSLSTCVSRRGGNVLFQQQAAIRSRNRRLLLFDTLFPRVRTIPYDPVPCLPTDQSNVVTKCDVRDYSRSCTRRCISSKTSRNLLMVVSFGQRQSAGGSRKRSRREREREEAGGMHPLRSPRHRCLVRCQRVRTRWCDDQWRKTSHKRWRAQRPPSFPLLSSPFLAIGTPFRHSRFAVSVSSFPRVGLHPSLLDLHLTPSAFLSSHLTNHSRYNSSHSGVLSLRAAIS
jgi:hypothetical protein